MILQEDAQPEESCYCAVMWAMVEVFKIHVYIGLENYRLYRKVSDGLPVSAGEFFGLQYALSLELIQASAATSPDKQLLKAVNYPMRKGVPVPQFRAFRPCYRPWYVTQAEAELLIHCGPGWVLEMC